MRVSPKGRKFITSHEGEILFVYKDPIGLPTVGVGHLVKPEEKSKYPLGKKITKAESQELLTQDLEVFEDAVSASLKVGANQNEFDAMVSLAFNIGIDAFKRSSVLRHFNSGNKAAAARAFLAWNKAKSDGKLVVLPGLDRRRKEERDLFLTQVSPVESNNPPKPSEAKPPVSSPPISEDKTQSTGDFFTKATDFLADKKTRLAKIGVDPGTIGKPSILKIAFQYVMAAVFAGYAFFRDNPIALVGVIAFIGFGVYAYNASKNRAQERKLNA